MLSFSISRTELWDCIERLGQEILVLRLQAMVQTKTLTESMLFAAIIVTTRGLQLWESSKEIGRNS